METLATAHFDLRRGSGRPRLLVSVASPAEAELAALGGAEIVDVKDPGRGSLGAQSPAVMAAISEDFCRDHPRIPLSVALGECREWSDSRPFALPAGVAFAKIGLAGLRDVSDWEAEWLRVRNEFDAARPGRIQWVAAAYVDFAPARSPAVAEVVEAAIQTGCRGVLLDTFDKTSGRLTDYVVPGELRQLADQLHVAGLWLAVAGRLRPSDLPELAGLPVDVIAVRSAACEDDNRQRGVTQDRVAACRNAIVDGSRAVMSRSFTG